MVGSLYKTGQLNSIFIFFVVFLVGIYWIYSSELQRENEQYLLLGQVVNSQASTIERRLSHSLSTTYILAQELRRANGEFVDFDKYAREVIRTISGVSNLQLAPKGIIAQIYPLKGNEKAIGHNLLVDDSRKKEAHMAIAKRKLTLAGPFDLIQGGVAVIGRNPVFIEGQDGEYFWGFTSALIFLNDLISITDLRQLESAGYSFEISRLHPDSGKEEVFARSISGLSFATYSTGVSVPNGTWKLTMSRVSSGVKIFLISGTIGSFFTALIISMLSLRIFREPHRLKSVVEEKTKELEYFAFHDPLTGLANRQRLRESLERQIQEMKAKDKYLTVMYVDLDDFKRVNDTMGHEAGDRLLQIVAKRIKGSVRNNDMVARLGGDEFAILLADLDGRDDAVTIASNVIQSIVLPVHLGPREAIVSATCGITVFPEDSENADELLRYADLALYASKRSGKNRYGFFEQDMQKEAHRWLYLEDELLNAIRNNELILVYQPVYSLGSGEVARLEALIRWNHPQRGLLLPESFIDIAEQTGLIIPLGQWILKEVCEFIREGSEYVQDVPVVSVNISARQVSEPSFAEYVIGMLDKFKVSPAAMELEITETIVMEDIDFSLKVLNRLRDAGLRLAMDDFGTGHSSLSQLKRLPIDTLKIDRSFIIDIETDSQDYQIIEVIVAMARKLGVAVVAEGIESKTQLELLKQAGCDMGQGIYFGEPEGRDNLKI